VNAFAIVFAMNRRRCVRALGLAAVMAPAALAGRASATEADGWAALQAGGIALFRHANAPGTGDPPGMQLGACHTQRNLDAVGRAEAQRIGQAFRARAIAIGDVWASQWCRASETAELGFSGRWRVETAFNSFFGDRAVGPAQTAEARRKLLAWAGQGALVVVTHQVNITALTGIVPASGEAVVLTREGGELRVVGRLRP
jgi:phosphohistidine phosphatase SixA